VLYLKSSVKASKFSLESVSIICLCAYVFTIPKVIPKIMLAGFSKTLRRLSFANSGLGDVRLEILVSIALFSCFLAGQ
jgi:hypothetical protein